MAVRYDQETKDRVIRMFEERREEVPTEFRSASYRRLNELTGIPIRHDAGLDGQRSSRCG